MTDRNLCFFSLKERKSKRVLFPIQMKVLRAELNDRNFVIRDLRAELASAQAEQHRRHLAREYAAKNAWLTRREAVVNGKCATLRNMLRGKTKKGLLATIKKRNATILLIRKRAKEAKQLAKKWEDLSCELNAQANATRAKLAERSKLAWIEELKTTARNATGREQKGKYSYPWQLQLLAIEMMGHETANRRVVLLIAAFFQSIGVPKKQLPGARAVGHWRDSMAYMVRVQVGLALTSAALVDPNQTFGGDGTSKDHTEIVSFVIDTSICSVAGIPWTQGSKAGE
jgi:hypothetical protein